MVFFFTPTNRTESKVSKFSSSKYSSLCHLTSHLHMKYNIDILQYHHAWLDGSVLSYQDWFYPRKQTNYLYSWQDFLNDLDSINIPEIPQHHKYFQPQMRNDFNCSALAMTGYDILNNWQWIMINCSKIYTKVTIVCEISNNGTSPNIWHYINPTIFYKLYYASKLNNKLHVPLYHCKPEWIHDGESCVSFEIGYKKNKSGCVHVDKREVHASLQGSISTVRNIFQQFLDMHITGGSNPMYLSKCTEPLFSALFSALVSASVVLDVFFQCFDGTLIIQHHVCDGEADCPDATNEANCSWVCELSINSSTVYYDCFIDCMHPNCTCHPLYFNCRSGGCISFSKFCNGITDCSDASDETLCEIEPVMKYPTEDHDLFTCESGDQIKEGRINDTVPDCPFHGDDETWLSNDDVIVVNQTIPLVLQCIPGHPKVYTYHQICLLTWQRAGELATCRNGGHLSDCIYHSCPQYYKCVYSYCIPLQAVCNGVIDCPYGEDEKDCEKLSYPNTLKCKRDNICVHFNNINDGIVDCPAYEDDEATAEMAMCPQHCQCMGHAAFCTRGNFSNFVHFKVLIFRNLPSVAFTTSPFVNFLALKYLDLANNKLYGLFSFIFSPLHSLVTLILRNISISEIQPYTFDGLLNVRDLQLHNNSIYIIHTDGFNGLLALTSLDLSRLNIRTVRTCAFRGLPQLLRLDLSYNMIEELLAETLCGLDGLQVLYLQNNNIMYVDAQAFSFTTHLQLLASNVTGLCCYVDVLDCTPKFEDEFASCSNILHHGSIKYTIYTIAIVSIGLNSLAFCIIKLFFAEKTPKNTVSNMFRKHLLLSDALMGIVFLISSVFDILYTGDFVMVGHLWRQSVYCRLLSFISMVSLEMTLFMVLIIAVERFLAMCFPFKNIHMSVNSALITIALQWFAASLVSLPPVLNLYFDNLGLNNAMCVAILCIDLLSPWIVACVYVTNTVVTVTNLVMYVAVIRAVRNMQHNKQFSHARRKREHSVTIRIILLIFTNSCYWLVLGTVGLLHMNGIFISKTMFAGIATVVLPASTLLNPILNVFTTTTFFDKVKLICVKA